MLYQGFMAKDTPFQIRNLPLPLGGTIIADPKSCAKKYFNVDFYNTQGVIFYYIFMFLHSPPRTR